MLEATLQFLDACVTLCRHAVDEHKAGTALESAHLEELRERLAQLEEAVSAYQAFFRELEP